MNTDPRRTYAWQKLRKARLAIAVMNNEPCALCHRPIDYTQNGNHPLGPTIDHTHPVIRGGNPYPPMEELQAAHRRCQSRQGARLSNPRRSDAPRTREKAAQKRAIAKLESESTPVVLPRSERLGPAPRRVSLPWSPDQLGMPPEAVPPRLATPPHPRATGSYGPELIEWAKERAGMHPKRTTAHRWWQEYVLTRALEHDKDGRLVWRTVVLSTPRQMGKSWLLRELCMWRLAQAERLGEVQTVVHAASKLSQAYGVWRPAAFWARHNGYQVRLANGEQSITATDGSQWLIQAANDDLGVSLSVGLGVVDEAWNVQREVFENGLEPTAAEAADAQMWLISTAGRKSAGDPAAASDLMPTYRDHGLRSLDAPGSLLFLEWSAPQGADIDSPEVWRSATPHWTEERLELVGGHRAKATSAEAQEAFAMQWLNQWPDQQAADRWLPGFGSQRFEGEVSWGCAAVEAAYGFPPVVALAGWAGDGRLVVTAKQCASVPDAAMAVFDAGDVPVRVGKSLLHDPVWQPFDPEAMVGTAAKSAMEFRTLVDEGVLWHDGSEVLAEQVRDCDIVYGPDGPRVASRSSRLDAIKAVTWAAVGLRNAPEVAKVF